MKNFTGPIEFSAPPLQDKDLLTMTFCGDWAPALGRISKQVIARGKDYYGDLTPYLDQSNLNVVNCETVIDDKKRTHVKAGVRLIDSREVVQSLIKGGFHLAGLANNHIYDNSKEGVLSTIAQLQSQGIQTIGAGERSEEIYRAHTIEDQNGKVAILNFGDCEEASEALHHGVGGADIYSFEAFQSVRDYKERGYFVILFAHAGVEFVPLPHPSLRKIYRQYIDAGVDLIIGHHPHVVQAFETYKGRPIFYSLGNFGIFRRQSRHQETIGMSLQVHIKNASIQSINLLPYQVSAERISLLKGDSLRGFQKDVELLNSLLSEESQFHGVWQTFYSQKNVLRDFFAVFRSYFSNKEQSLAKAKLLALKGRYLSSPYEGLQRHVSTETDQENLRLLEKYEVFRSDKKGVNGWHLLALCTRPLSRLSQNIKEALRPFYHSLRGKRS